MDDIGGSGEAKRFGVTHFSPGDVHEHSEAGHVITLAADVGAVSENHLAALR